MLTSYLYSFWKLTSFIFKKRKESGNYRKADLGTLAWPEFTPEYWKLRL